MTNAPDGKPSYKWRPASGRGAEPVKPGSRRWRIVRGLAGILLVASLIIAVAVAILRPAPRSFFLPIFITDQANWLIPPNAFARQDGEALLQFREGTADSRYFGSSFNTAPIQEKEDLQGSLNALLDPGKHGQHNVIVYVNALLACDREGKIYLQPSRATPGNPEKGLLLEDVVDKIIACPARNKLLVLDVMKATADLRWGVLADDMAWRVHELIKGKGDPNLLILCACSPGQTSHVSETLRRSVFGYYFELALRGWANGWGPNGRKDSIVTAREAASFVQAKVDQWAHENGALPQTPMLLGAEGFDFELVRIPGNGPERIDDLVKESREYPRWLFDGWKLRDAWLADGTHALAPAAFHRLEASLLVAEKRWRAGMYTAAAGTEQPDIEKKVKTFTQEWQAIEEEVKKVCESLSKSAQPASVALAAGLRWLQPENERLPAEPNAKTIANELAKGLESVRWPSGSVAEAAAKEDAPKKVREKFLAHFAEKPPASAQDLCTKCRFPLLETLLVAMRLTTNNHMLDVGRTRFYDDLLQEFRLSAESGAWQYTETQIVPHIRALVTRDVKPADAWMTEPVRKAIKVALLAEQAMALRADDRSAWDPRIFDWMRTELDEACQSRFDAEIFLASPGFVRETAAGASFREAEDRFNIIMRSAGKLLEAYATRDRALAVLPSYADYLSDCEEQDWDAWKAAMKAAIELDKRLRPGTSLDEVRNSTDTLKDRLSRLPLDNQNPENVKKVENLAKSLQNGPTATPKEKLKAALALLATPRLTAELRRKLWQSTQGYQLEIDEKTRKRDFEPASDLRPMQFDEKAARQQEQERARRRVEVFLKLLELGQEPDGHGLREKLEHTLKGNDPKGWPSLADSLRKHWSKLAEKSQGKATSLEEDAGNNRLVHIAHPLDLKVVAEGRAPLSFREPSERYWKWLAGRLRYSASGLKDIGVAKETTEFLEKTADRYDTSGGGSERFPKLEVGADAGLPNLNEDNRQASYPLVFQLNGNRSERSTMPKFTPMADDEWLDVKGGAVNEQGSAAYNVPLSIELKPEADTTSRPPPKGFLVQARYDGKNYYCRVEVGLPPTARERLRIYLSRDEEGKDEIPEGLRLRPNTEQKVFIWMLNPSAQKRKVQVELIADQKPYLSDELELDPGSRKMVPPLKASRPAPAANTPLITLVRPELRLRLYEIKDNKKERVAERPLLVAIRNPSEYVEIEGSPQYDPEKKRLTAKVRLKEKLPDQEPPVPVKMTLSSDRIPGLLGSAPAQIERLDNNRKNVELNASNLQFEEEREDRNGHVLLDVDGCPLAFVYNMTFAPSGIPLEGSQLLGPRVLPLKNDILAEIIAPAVIGADRDISVGVALDRNNDSNFDSQEVLKEGGQWQELLFDCSSPQGGLLFKTLQRPHEFRLNKSGLVDGTYGIRVRLLKGKDPLKDSAVLSRLTVDASKPSNLRFLSINDTKPSDDAESQPKVRIKEARELKVVVEGKDDHSGIHQVRVFLGEPQNDALPSGAKTVAAKAMSGDKTRWAAKIDVPLRATQETFLTVEFTNGAGLKEYKTVVVEFLQQEKNQGWTIKGKVLNGDSGRPNLTVYLRDRDTKKETTAVSDNLGEYKFTRVPAGNYELSVKDTDGRIARMDVTVTEADKTVDLSVKLP